jgi:hypothetical protein
MLDLLELQATSIFFTLTQNFLKYNSCMNKDSFHVEILLIQHKYFKRWVLNCANHILKQVLNIVKLYILQKLG